MGYETKGQRFVAAFFILEIEVTVAGTAGVLARHEREARNNAFILEIYVDDGGAGEGARGPRKKSP
jgi:hypothetical protein